MSIRDLYNAFLQTEIVEEESPERHYGMIIDEDEEVYDEVAYLSYWEGLNQEL